MKMRFWTELDRYNLKNYDLFAPSQAECWLPMLDSNPFKSPSEFQPTPTQQSHPQPISGYAFLTAFVCAGMTFLGYLLLLILVTSISLVLIYATIGHPILEQPETPRKLYFLNAVIVGLISIGTATFAGLRSYRNTIRLFSSPDQPSEPTQASQRNN